MALWPDLVPKGKDDGFVDLEGAEKKGKEQASPRRVKSLLTAYRNLSPRRQSHLYDDGETGVSAPFENIWPEVVVEHDVHMSPFAMTRI